MTDENDPFTPRPIERWFYVAAVASVVFMAAGCFAYVAQVTADPATLPPDERYAVLAQPSWLVGVNAIAVWAGLAGAVLLLVRRRFAEFALLVSLAAAVIWLVGLGAVSELRSAMSTNDWVVALVVVAITWTIYWFARHSRQRGWLA